VDSISLPRIIATAETQLTSPPGFFFSAMPTSRTPQSAAKAKKAAAVAALKKKRAQTVAASGDATKGLETPAQAEEVGSVPGPSSGAGSSREADPGGGSHTTSSSATGSQPPKPPEGGGDPGGGSAEVRKGVKPSQGSAKSPTKRKSARKEGTDAPSSAKKTGGAPNPVVDQQRPAEGPGGGDGVVQEEAGESTHDSDSDAMDKSSDSASLSFGSDTDFLSDTYVIVDPEVKRGMERLYWKVFCTRQQL
jgi:hypothetical protein